MPKRVALTDMAVKKLKKPGRYSVGGEGADGLLLQVLDSGARSWILRYTWGTRISTGDRHSGKPIQRRREVGLGGYPTVGLAEARAKAVALKAKIAEGVDPISARRAERSARAVEAARAMTFEAAALAWLDTKALEWKNPKDHPRWTSQFERRVFPTLGKVHLADIQTQDVVRVLEGCWLDVADTARKLRNYIGNIFDWAIVKTYIQGPNPTPSKTQMDVIAGNSSKIIKKTNNPALPIPLVGKFMADLRSRSGMGARSLEFLILTATRSSEVMGAYWSEIDMKAKVWTIPATRMKAGKEHRVPLSPPALAILEALPTGKPDDLVFPSAAGGMQSNETLSAVIDRMHEADLKSGGVGYIDPREKRVATPHGMRSTFRDWAGEHTDHLHEVAEMALAHTVRNQSEAAYRRGDLLDKRKPLMSDWAKFCGTR